MFRQWVVAQVGRAYLPPWDVHYLEGIVDEMHVYQRVLLGTEVRHIVSQEDTGAGWQYGVSMAPPYIEYQSIEMPTSGMHWTSPPFGVTYYFFVSATTDDKIKVFAQCGFVYNGLNIIASLQGGATNLPPDSWGMFWMYYKHGMGYCGDIVLLSSGWLPTHRIYYSIAVYTSRGYLSYLFYNSDRDEYILEQRYPGVEQYFTGNVGSLAESKERSEFRDIYVDRVAVWAQIPGTRSCGPGYAFDANTASYDADVLSAVLINNETEPYVVEVGFDQGTHYSDNDPLWSGTYYLGEELFPPECPPHK